MSSIILFVPPCDAAASHQIQHAATATTRGCRTNPSGPNLELLREQYEATVAAVHPSDGLPEGQVFHAAGPSADGWTVVAIHDSKESWERFRDGTLMPRMQAGIDGGFAAPPEESTFEVHNTQIST
jgi:hypothetical protein